MIVSINLLFYQLHLSNRTKAIAPHHIVISSTSLIISRTIVGLQAFFWSKEVLLLVFFAFKSDGAFTKLTSVD